MQILYTLSHGMALRAAANDTGRNTLTLIFEPCQSGALIIGGKILPLEDGRVEIPMSKLEDGEYAPKLETDKGIYLAEGFIKSGKSISLPKIDEATLRRLISKLFDLENELCLTKKRVSELERICSGHKIFDFGKE